MSDEPIEALITDLLIWLGPHERPYEEVMPAWCTALPTSAGLGRGKRARPHRAQSQWGPILGNDNDPRQSLP